MRNRGNLKEMERDLGQPYQALRNRLNEVIAEMGFEVSDEDDAEELRQRRRDVLEQLDRGDIDAATAARSLNEIKTGGLHR